MKPSGPCPHIKDTSYWLDVEQRLMRDDTSELMMFCVMQNRISFVPMGKDDFAVANLPECVHREIFERVFEHRKRDIRLYIDTKGSSSEIPTAENAARKAAEILRGRER